MHRTTLLAWLCLLILGVVVPGCTLADDDGVESSGGSGGNSNSNSNDNDNGGGNNDEATQGE